MVFGVCGGVAESLEIDANLVRLAFVLLAVAGGFGAILYVIAAVILPTEDLAGAPPRQVFSENFRALVGSLSLSRGTLGGILLGIGLVWLAGSLGVLTWVSLGWAVPAFLIIIGASILWSR